MSKPKEIETADTLLKLAAKQLTLAGRNIFHAYFYHHKELNESQLAICQEAAERIAAEKNRLIFGVRATIGKVSDAS